MRLAERISRIKPSATLAINAKAKALIRSGIDIINFGVGEPDFDTPENIQEAAIRAMRRGQTRYTAVGGVDELKDAIRKTLKTDYGIEYGRPNVLVSCGGKHALYNLFQALLDPADEVLIPSPFWVSYPDMVQLVGAKPVTIECPEENGFRLRPEDLDRAITPATRLLILNSPSNPTGKYYGREHIEELAAVLLKHEHVLIASDDIYYRILFEGREWVNLAMVEPRLTGRMFIINGVSKTYCMTGWRIGYLVGDPAVINAATDVQSQSTSNPSSISQWAAVEALENGQEQAREMTASFERRSKLVMERLSKIPGVTCTRPEGAFYVFPNFSSYYGRRTPEGTTISGSLDLAGFLMEKAHVAAVPGGPFGEDRCLRFSYALSDEEIRKGFDAIESALGLLR